MKKSHQYIIIGGIGIIILYLILHKRAILQATDLSQPKRGGGGGGQLAEGMTVQSDFLKCVQMGIPRTRCEDMIPL